MSIFVFNLRGKTGRILGDRQNFLTDFNRSGLI